MKDDKTSKDPTTPSKTPRDGLPQISVPSIPKIPKIGVLTPNAPSIPSIKAPSEHAPQLVDSAHLPQMIDSDDVHTLASDVEIVPVEQDDARDVLEALDAPQVGAYVSDEADLPMLEVMPLEVTPLESATEIDDSDYSDLPSPLMEATKAPVILEDMEVEATMLMTESEGLFLGDPDLDDFEENDATMVFDSMSGLDLASVQAGSLDISSMVPGVQSEQILERTPAPESTPAPALNWDSGAPLRGTEAGAADDFTAQATEILQSPFEQDLVTPKLKFLAGPVQGQESFISGLVATFGRGEQNTMMVADLAMSRNHFELSRQPDESFVVRDLGSANGTLLNGTAIKEAALYHGDRIEAGKSTMVFEAPNVKPKAQRYLIPAQAQMTVAGLNQPTPMNELTSMAAIQVDQTTRFFTRISIGAAVVCVPLIGALLFLSLRPTETVAAPTAVAAGVEQPLTKKKAADLYLSGVESVKAREWKEAQESFEQAKAIDSMLNIEPQLALLGRERKAQKAFAKAQSLVSENKQNEVNAIVDTIPPESVYASDAYKLKRQQLRDDLESLYKAAQSKFSEEQLDESEALARQVIERSPEHEGAKTLLASISTRKAEIEQAANAANAASTKAPNPFGAGTRPTNAPTVDAGAEDIKRGIALYRKGNFDQAVAAFKSSTSPKAKKFVRHVSTFKSVYPSGKSAFKKKQWSKAISQLERARRADRLVSNSYKRNISEMLSTAHGQKGIESVKSGKYRSARTSYITGKRYGNSTAIRELNQTLESKAKTLYIKATSIKRSDPDKAGLLCRKIMLMVPTSSPTWKKAQRVMMDF